MIKSCGSRVEIEGSPIAIEIEYINIMYELAQNGFPIVEIHNDFKAGLLDDCETND